MEKIIVDCKSFEIELETNRYQEFANTLNSVLELINKELPQLHFTVDAAFLMSMVKGEVKTKILASYADKYLQMLKEHEIETVYGNAGLEIDMFEAVKLYQLPAISSELEGLLASIFNTMNGEGLNLSFFQISNEKFEVTRQALKYIEAKYSLVLEGKDAELWKAYSRIANRLNQFSHRYWDGRTIPIEYIFAKTNEGYQPAKTCIPHIFADFQNARVAKHSTSGAPEPAQANAPAGSLSF